MKLVSLFALLLVLSTSTILVEGSGYCSRVLDFNAYGGPLPNTWPGSFFDGTSRNIERISCATQNSGHVFACDISEATVGSSTAKVIGAIPPTSLFSMVVDFDQVVELKKITLVNVDTSSASTDITVSFGPPSFPAFMDS